MKGHRQRVCPVKGKDNSFLRSEKMTLKWIQSKVALQIVDFHTKLRWY